MGRTASAAATIVSGHGLEALRPNGVLYQAQAVAPGERRVPDDPRARALLGLEGVDRHSWWHAVLAQDLDGALAGYLQFITAGESLDIQYRIQLPDGSQRWLRDRARVVERAGDGVPLRLFGVIDDVTACNSLQRRAQEASDKYRLLFDSIDAGFCVIEVLFDAAGEPEDYRFLEVNAAFEGITGIRDGVGRRMREFAGTHERHWFETYGRIARTGIPERFENSAEQLGFYYDVYAFRVGDPGLNQVGVLFTDITQRKRAEDALREDGRRKTEFIAMLAHELRNPLATITSGLQAMKLGSHGVASHPATAMMERQVGQMRRLLDDLLDINRITLGKVHLRRERCDLVQLLRQVSEAFQPHYDQQGLVLDWAWPVQPLWVKADPARLMQVFGNLLSNAAKFSNPGGRVTLSLQHDGQQAVIQVRDQGVGIEAAQLESIFELFAQVDSERNASSGGLGVGIALARQLVEMHQGQILAHSDGLGHGSTFTVCLPLDLQSSAPPALAPPEEPVPANDGVLHILLIDDNHDAADSISMVLELLGHRVTTCYSGQQGLDALAAARPDLVFTDIGMPGMDGHEVCRRMRAMSEGAPLKIVALTGWGTLEDRAQSAQAGFDYHLVKPITTAKLREALGIISGRLPA
ncbi:hybrid sensor histidine kinase/response regulator [Pseudoxanthomonas spadix]|uniref:hybrid sensor histidine kinase/response regulator n=1 Tax=Pseudoxanthomonas spadix TaxID=415229 RepID=UPI0014731048|nr:ATP-binding protein [Pseudoxanthomonas spadix]MBP3973254.1 response regulator [Pseudoxanthomonas spadix]